MDGYSVEPPDSVWENVSMQTGGKGRRRVLFIWFATAASLALALSLGLRYFTPDRAPEDALAVEDSRSPVGDPHTLREDETPEPGQDGVAHNLEGEASRPGRGRSLEEKVAEVLLGEEISAEPRIAEAADLSPALEETGQPGEPVYPVHSPDQGTPVDTPAETPGQEDGQAETPAPAPTMTSVDAAGKIVLDAGEPRPEDEFETGEQREKDPRWVMGAMLSPLYSYRDAEPEALAGSNNQESGRLSYATGVQVAYRAGKRLAIESGIIYNRMGINIGAPGIQLFEPETEYMDMGPQNSYASEMRVLSNSVGNIVARSGEIYINNYKLNAQADGASAIDRAGLIADHGLTQHLNYLEVPLNLRYSVVDSRLKVQLVGGLSTNVLVDNYLTVEGAEGPEEIGYLTNVQTLNYSGNAGIGFVYYFFRQMSLSLEPRFRYYLNSVNDNTLPDTRPWSFGIYTGLNYSF